MSPQPSTARRLPAVAVRERDGRRALELEIEVDAPVEAVWEALSTAEGLRRWFVLDAAVEPGEGGSIWLSWGPGCEGKAPLTGWEPGRRLEWTEERPPETEGGAPVRVAVDFTVEARRGGGAVVRLVQSGFGSGAGWDDELDAVRRGWTYFLWSLRHALEAHPGAPRKMAWTRRRAGASRDEVWTRLFGPGGLDVAAAAVSPDASPEPGAPFAPALAGRHRGRVVLAERPWTFAATLDDEGGAVLFVELEMGGEGWHGGLWLSTYGLDDARVAELQAAVDALADRVLTPAASAAS